ncbi:MAG: alpha/beta hydrolase [Fluviicola sp.]|nr:MAG: alpha/beta hydrolase [Fluviicola sp.]
MSKPNLLLLHGALGSKAHFDSLRNLLSDQFNVIDLNFEGHGNQITDNEFSIELFADNVLALLKEQNITKTDIFGYSMGGYVGLKLALSHPELVGKILTLGTKFNWTKAVSEQEVRKLNPEIIAAKVPVFAQRLEELHSADSWKIVVNKTAKMMLDLGNGKKISDASLAQLNNQITIGIGELDNMVTLEESQRIAELLPNGKLEIISGFKHPIEQIDVQELANFILSKQI